MASAIIYVEGKGNGREYKFVLIDTNVIREEVYFEGKYKKITCVQAMQLINFKKNSS